MYRLEEHAFFVQKIYGHKRGFEVRTQKIKREKKNIAHLEYHPKVLLAMMFSSQCASCDDVFIAKCFLRWWLHRKVLLAMMSSSQRASCSNVYNKRLELRPVIHVWYRRVCDRRTVSKMPKVPKYHCGCKRARNAWPLGTVRHSFVATMHALLLVVSIVSSYYKHWCKELLSEDAVKKQCFSFRVFFLCSCLNKWLTTIHSSTKPVCFRKLYHPSQVVSRLLTIFWTKYLIMRKIEKSNRKFQFLILFSSFIHLIRTDINTGIIRIIGYTIIKLMSCKKAKKKKVANNWLQTDVYLFPPKW